jgi:A/G-specific adenine glycosylase
VIPPGQACLFNSALLDFGALVCTSRRPKCTLCPLWTLCSNPRTSTRT